MSDANDQAVQKIVAARCGFSIPPFPSEVRTPHGQIVTLIQPSGEWVAELRIEDICIGAQVVPWGHRFTDDVYIEWVIRAFAIWRIQRAIRVRPLIMVLRAAALIPVRLDGDCGGDAIHEWTAMVDSEAATAAGPDLREGMIGLLEYGVAMGFPGFDARALRFARSSLRCAYSLVRVLRRPGDAPFTVSEVAAIDEAIRTSDALTSRERALLLVARDTGIRPIQMALLIWSDLRTDELGPYLDVPSVKGKVRSKRRRAVGNFRRRYLSNAAHSALEEYRCESESEANRLLYRAQITLRIVNINEVNRPIFPHARESLRTIELSGHESLAPYLLHSTGGEISLEIGHTTVQLAVADDRGGREARLKISATRMRRTKATSLVMQGCSAEEIAEAMDHKSTASLKSYFLYSKDVEDMVRSDGFSTAEIELAAERWRGRIIQRDAADASRRKGRPILDLGVCLQVEDCTYWPTVTCYSCSRFRPYAQADHATAKAHILDVKDAASGDITGPYARMLDGAIQGVSAVITACHEVMDKSDG
ncbi:site-specific integrase [Luteibacter sp. NPDC031894]|uniref:site-specific integrase n=1 Tax=Luteibacter sp. NPDC031894 TaxID=3390572 RepID=UPI003CFD7F7F